MKKWWRSLFLIVGAGFFLGLILIAVSYYYFFYPLDQNGERTVNFVIPRGQSVKIIGDRLQAAGLIRSSWAFQFFVRYQGLANQIQAGSFELPTHASLWQLAQLLTRGTNDLWLTIPEGWRREEIANLAEKNLSDFQIEEFLQLTKDKEGYLFPDTYLLPKLTTAQTLTNILLDTFDQKVKKQLAPEIAQSPYSLSEIITLASIVQREAKTAEQMRLVAGVLQKRLEINMPLQVDATLQYLKGYDQISQTWWPMPLSADKKIDSPYNTYLYAGLPPAPIANPGLDAIKAVLRPGQTDYLYYLHDSRGGIHFARTFVEHQANINRYLR